MAIAAHFASTPQPGKQPRGDRRTLLLDLPGTPASGAATRVLVHNISASGLLIECDAELAEDERIDLELPQAGTTAARVVWRSGNFHGCRFDSELSAAALSAARLQSIVDDAEPAQRAGGAGEEEPLGMRLHRLRLARGMSLGQLAERLGVSKPTVWAWEQGRARPVAERMDAIAAALDVAPESIVPSANTPQLQDVLARSRERIAEAYGTTPDKVRIMLEL